MRKFFVIFLMLAFVLLETSGCVRELVKPDGSEDSDARIHFSAADVLVSAAFTKAEDWPPTDADGHPIDQPSVNLLEDGNQMVVYGGHLSGQQVESVFKHMRVTFHAGENEDKDAVNASGNGWQSDFPRYWKRSGSYRFMAVYPYITNKNNCSCATDFSQLVVTYRVHGDDFDLMVADAGRDMSTVYDHSTVPLHFRHACSAIRFIFKKGATVHNYWLHSFELQNVKTVGALVHDFAVQSDGKTAPVTRDSWILIDYQDPRVFDWEASTSSDPDKAVPGTYAQFVRDRSNDLAKWHYVIPQTASDYSGTQQPTIYFSILVNKDSNPNTEPIYMSLPVPDIDWQPGKIYNYYIQIQPSQADIKVVTTDWEDEYFYYLGADDIIF